MPARRTSLVAGVGAGLVVGALSSFGRPHLDGTLDAFVNSTSTWLVAPFLVGTLAAARREAAVAGFATCASQLVAYYVVDSLQGIGTTRSLVAFWAICAIVGGPVFGMAGHLWRTAAPRLKGLGIAVLAGIFIAEGWYAYLHQQHRYLTAVVWIGFGTALALLSSRGRVEQLRWLGLTLPLGISGEAALTLILHRFF
jgi:hypothetical protein